ncbi:MAG: TRAP transporter small permease [Proteobacteria bacterium]|nr:TRAP transporter small permease [Pseudomonadota bacterium]
MAGSTAGAAAPHGAAGKFLEKLTGTWATLGGFVLAAIMVIESGSVIGRGLSATPVGTFLGVRGISGDTEIVEVCSAVAIFAFLPYCQLTRANVFVDFFTKGLPVRARSSLDAAANLLFLVIAFVVAWRLGHAVVEKWEYRDTTIVLRIPEVVPYALSLVSAWLLVATTGYTVLRSLAEIRDGRPIGPQPDGDH